MNNERLPEDEPGAPLVRVNPGFADKVMHRVEKFDRKQTRASRGMSLFAVLAVAVIIAVIARDYAARMSAPEISPPQLVKLPRMEASPGGGVVVKSIDGKSSLAKAGVRKGDVVKSINHHTVNDAALAVALLRAMDHCKQTEFVVVRDSTTRTVTTPPLNAAPCRSPGVMPR